MAKARLDPRLLTKLARKLGKGEQYVREQLSRFAGREGITSEAAFVLKCREAGIGTAHYLHKQPDAVKAQVRDAISRNGAASIRPSASLARTAAPARVRKSKPTTKQLVDSLILDPQLRDRCRDIICALRNHDRVVREATTVLDDRLKNLTGIRNMKPEGLVGKVLNPDPNEAVIEISSDASVQQGFFKICNGLMLAYRHDAHHRLSDRYSQTDALKFCGLVDLLLCAIEKGTLHRERTSNDGK